LEKVASSQQQRGNQCIPVNDTFFCLEMRLPYSYFLFEDFAELGGRTASGLCGV
jgi:hypothetical protein